MFWLLKRRRDIGLAMSVRPSADLWMEVHESYTEYYHGEIMHRKFYLGVISYSGVIAL